MQFFVLEDLVTFVDCKYLGVCDKKKTLTLTLTLDNISENENESNGLNELEKFCLLLTALGAGDLVTEYLNEPFLSNMKISY